MIRALPYVIAFTACLVWFALTTFLISTLPGFLPPRHRKVNEQQARDQQPKLLRPVSPAGVVHHHHDSGATA